MEKKDKIAMLEQSLDRKLTTLEMYENRPRKWILYLVIVLAVTLLVGWSADDIHFTGLTATGTEVAKGVVHGVFHPDTNLLFGTGDSDVPYLLLQTIAIAVLGTIFGAILAIEDLDTHILESLDAMGCTPFQKIRYGVLPQLTASFISTTIYRFDINLKDATTLGIVGAGGIGASLVQCLNSRRWGMVGSFVWGLMVLVLIIELISTRIRRKLAHGE